MKNKTKYFEIFQKMIDDNNRDIAISTTIVNTTTTPQGGTIEFGVEPEYCTDARIGQLGLPSKNMCFAVFVSKEEFEKYKNK